METLQAIFRKLVITVMLLSGSSALANDISQCKNYLKDVEGFLVEGRLVTESLELIIQDMFALFEGTHVIHLKRSRFAGQLGAYFENTEIEIRANQIMSFENPAQYRVSGRLVEVSNGTYMFKIEKLWERPLVEQGDLPETAELISFKKKSDKFN